MRCTSSMLTVTLRPNGWLVISSLVDAVDGRIESLEILLSPGEHFGGHTYEEWCAVAKQTGQIAADWLDV